MSGEIFTLKECLVEFLNGSISEMPQVEAQITSLEPLKICDSGYQFFEINALSDEILERVEADPSQTYKLILLDWNFVIKKVPNSKEYYMDIKAKNFRVMACEAFVASQTSSSSMMEDIDIK